MVLGHWKNAKVETNKDNKVLDPFAGCRRRRQSSSAEYAGKLNMKRVETRDFTLIALFILFNCRCKNVLMCHCTADGAGHLHSPSMLMGHLEHHTVTL